MPNSSRPRVTWNGAYPSVPTLMSRKLNPQIRDSAPKRMRQSSARRAPDGAGDAGGAPAGAGGAGRGDGAAARGAGAVVMGSTMQTA